MMEISLVSADDFIAWADEAMRQKDWPEAIKRWTMMREKFPDHPRGYVSGIAALKENKEFEAADALCLEGMEKFPKEGGLYAEYGNIAVRQKNWPEAIKRWALRREKFPRSSPGYFRGVTALKENQDFEEADALALEGLKKFPNSFHLYTEYGDIAMRQKNWPEAIKRWALMREKCPEHPRGYVSGTAALKENKEFAAADALVLEGLKKFPEESDLYIEYGDIAVFEENWPEAIKRWALMREKCPEHPRGYVSGVIALKKSEDFSAADALAFEGIKKFPKEPWLKMNYGKMSKEIYDITVFNDYLEKLNDIKDSLLIIMSVKDTLGLHFDKKSAELINKLGIKSNLNRKHGHSYIGIIDRGIVVKDELSINDESLMVEDKIFDGGKLCVSAFSSVFRNENLSSIIINDTDYSQNARGINIVLYDYNKSYVLDSVSFDTHSIINNCVRKKSRNYIISGMKNAISHHILCQELKKQREEINRLFNIIDLNNKKNELLLWSIFKKPEESKRQTRARFFRYLPEAEEPLKSVQKSGIILLRNFDNICTKNGIKYWIFTGTLLGAVRHNGFIPWDDDIDVCMLRDDFIKLKEILKENKHFQCVEYYKAIGPDKKYFAKRYIFKFKESLKIRMDIFIMDYADSNTEDKIKSINLIRGKFYRDYWRSSLQSVPSRGKQRSVVIAENDDVYTEYEEFWKKYLEEYKKLLGKDKKYIVWGFDNADFWFGQKRIFNYDWVFPLKRISFEGQEYLSPNKSDEYLQFLYGDFYSLPGDMHKHFHISEEDINHMKAIIEQYDNKQFN